MNQAGVNFIGTGWGFPPTFHRSSQTVTMVTGETDINESLGILLSTTMGERIMQPSYGCNLKRFLFEPTNASLEAHIKKLVEDAILYFEPRILLERVALKGTDSGLEIIVEYTIRSSNSRGNFVYPFYKEGIFL